MIKAKTMLARADEFLAFRRNLGYKLVAEGYLLREFGRFADESGHRGPITKELVLRWVRRPRSGTSNYLAQRFLVIRRLAYYLALSDPKTEIPPDDGFKLRRVRPHIYTEREIADLMMAGAELAPKGGLRPQTYCTFFGVLACTGLRVGEAIRLGKDDVDLERGILRISKTKFGKSRLVPIHASTRTTLRRYSMFRDQHHPIVAAKTFFLAESGTSLSYDSVCRTFIQIRSRLGWKGTPCKRTPRIHDLRHTFATQRLLRWYQDGVDVEHAIHSLSTYLGHSTLACTYWYLTGIPELLAICADRFQKYSRCRTLET